MDPLQNKEMVQMLFKWTLLGTAVILFIIMVIVPFIKYIRLVRDPSRRKELLAHDLNYQLNGINFFASMFVATISAQIFIPLLNLENKVAECLPEQVQDLVKCELDRLVDNLLKWGLLWTPIVISFVISFLYIRKFFSKHIGRMSE